MEKDCEYSLITEIPEETRVVLRGRLDMGSTRGIWDSLVAEVLRSKPTRLVVEAGDLEYCDSAGFSLLTKLRRLQYSCDHEFELLNLSADLTKLYQLIDLPDNVITSPVPKSKRSIIEILEEFGCLVLTELHGYTEFIGEVTVATVRLVRHPKRMRWEETWHLMRVVGYDALPLTLLIGFIMGVVLAFQSAIPLSRYGAELLVADVVALSLTRELGPLMTAVILAGRTGSSFAAELGTMKVNDEINALETLSINPIRFLVIPRMIAAVLMTPALTIYFELIGLVGGGLVLVSEGIPLISYIKEVQATVTYVDFSGGLLKSLVLGMLVAGIGCLRGLQTGSDAKAVGASTRSAVVSGIILIAIADGLFSWIYYRIGI